MEVDEVEPKRKSPRKKHSPKKTPAAKSKTTSMKSFLSKFQGNVANKTFYTNISSRTIEEKELVSFEILFLVRI